MLEEKVGRKRSCKEERVLEERVGRKRSFIQERVLEEKVRRKHSLICREKRLLQKKQYVIEEAVKKRRC